MFEDEFAKERQRAAAQQAEAEQHEQHIDKLMAAKDDEIDRARHAARAFRGLLWSLEDRGLLITDAKVELERLVDTYDDIDPDDEDGDES